MSSNANTPQDQERMRRWRLALGGSASDAWAPELSVEDTRIDDALGFLYQGDDDEPDGPGKGRRKPRGGAGRSQPTVARWLGDIREYFPGTVVEVMQRDAMERRGLKQMLLQPEVLESISPDVHLVTDLMSLGGVIPEKTKATARIVVRKVVDEILRRVDTPLRNAVSGALNRAVRNHRPRRQEIDWNRTIRANLKHYQAEHRTIIPQRLIGCGRRSPRPLRDVFLCIDQSGSMAASIVYSSIFGAVMASLPAVRTSLVLFDTSVVDMTDKLSDPVDVLFGVHLGGGTDIHQAVSYCAGLVREPNNSILILISDLIEGGDQGRLFQRVAEIVASGVQVIALLALSDEGRPSYDKDNATRLAAMGVPAFACTPDAFPELMAAAIRKEDVSLWAAQQGFVTARGQ